MLNPEEKSRKKWNQNILRNTLFITLGCGIACAGGMVIGNSNVGVAALAVKGCNIGAIVGMLVSFGYAIMFIVAKNSIIAIGVTGIITSGVLGFGTGLSSIGNINTGLSLIIGIIIGVIISAVLGFFFNMMKRPSGFGD